MNDQGHIAKHRLALKTYRAMVDFLDEDFDFSESTQKEYDAMAAEAIAAGFREV